jgi:probable HAF family extracellular repeat protein
VTGFAWNTGDAAYHAFVYSDGAMQDLGTLGGTLSGGLAINASGQVTGWSFIAGSKAYHAFLYSNGHMTDLNSLILVPAAARQHRDDPFIA